MYITGDQAYVTYKEKKSFTSDNDKMQLYFPNNKQSMHMELHIHR